MWDKIPKQACWMIHKIFKAKLYIEKAGMTKEGFLSCDSFSTTKIYLQLLGQYTKVAWRRLICNNPGSPKWLFIVNLVARGRLYTRDRLAQRGMVVDQSCPLCRVEQESIDHLFFKCTVSAYIWDKLLQWQGVPRKAISWTDELHWFERHCKGKSSGATMYRLTMTAAVYFVWQERNPVIFQNKSRTYNTIIRLIIQEIFVKGSMCKKLNRNLIRLNHYPT
ncbi:uncharacterized protein [Nicotiana tomentosiformis]|uniref:uncharacterized protein n=1 Tax=Nicotiana tomentosiformis TaxID=4098 RepID=UPI00388CB354